MLETLIAILLSLGLTFTKTDDGRIKLDNASLSKLEASAEYQNTFSGESPIVIVPDIDPIESPIVIVPDIDPKH